MPHCECLFDLLLAEVSRRTDVFALTLLAEPTFSSTTSSVTVTTVVGASEGFERFRADDLTADLSGDDDSLDREGVFGLLLLGLCNSQVRPCVSTRLRP